MAVHQKSNPIGCNTNQRDQFQEQLKNQHSVEIRRTDAQTQIWIKNTNNHTSPKNGSPKIQIFYLQLKKKAYTHHKLTRQFPKLITPVSQI